MFSFNLRLFDLIGSKNDWIYAQKVGYRFSSVCVQQEWKNENWIEILFFSKNIDPAPMNLYTYLQKMWCFSVAYILFLLHDRKVIEWKESILAPRFAVPLHIFDLCQHIVHSRNPTNFRIAFFIFYFLYRQLEFI